MGEGQTRQKQKSRIRRWCVLLPACYIMECLTSINQVVNAVDLCHRMTGRGTSPVLAMMITVCVRIPFCKSGVHCRLEDPYRGYDRSPHRLREHRHSASRQFRQAPPDPHTFDAPASLKQYAEWFRFYYPQQAIDEDQADKLAEQMAGDGTRPRNGIKARWERYKKDFLQKQVSSILRLRLFTCIICLDSLPYLLNLEYNISLNVLYDSFKFCLTSTGSPLGSLRGMIPSCCHSAPECGKLDGGVG